MGPKTAKIFPSPLAIFDPGGKRGKCAPRGREEERGGEGTVGPIPTWNTTEGDLQNLSLEIPREKPAVLTGPRVWASRRWPSICDTGSAGPVPTAASGCSCWGGATPPTTPRWGLARGEIASN